MFKKNRRTRTFLVCVVFLLVTFFSLFFLVEEIKHSCIGESCPVCACLHRLIHSLEELGTGIAGIAFWLFVTLPMVLIVVAASVFMPVTSLVSKKVRLDD